MSNEFSFAHVEQFVDLWIKLQEVNLIEEAEDDITWNLSTNGMYSASSAYKAQFLGMMPSDMKSLVWKAWAPSKIKHFAWLALQNKLWTADRLAKRGWPNCGLCPLCKQTVESVDHLLIHCRFTVRVWGLIKEWLGLHFVDTSTWTGLTLNEWWRLLIGPSSHHRKAMASLVLLTSWTIWNERNARVFRKKLAPSVVIFDIIKSDAKLWVYAGAKKLSEIMPGE